MREKKVAVCLVDYIYDTSMRAISENFSDFEFGSVSALYSLGLISDEQHEAFINAYEAAFMRRYQKQSVTE